jgi:four helix bundle protein
MAHSSWGRGERKMRDNMEKGRFSFEDLEVWQKAVKFADDVIGIIDTMDTPRKHYRLIENAEAAAVSISSNIAEGKGRYSKKEFIQHLYIARGSLYETINFLIIFNTKKWINEKELTRIKEFGAEIGKQISALINAIRKSL